MASIVINCDDLGMNEATNKAIGLLFKKKLITSCSCLVNFAETSSAKKIAEDYNFTNKIGLHFNITEGYPLTEKIKTMPRFCREKKFHGQYRSNRSKIFRKSVATNFLTLNDISALKLEFDCQVDKFINIFNILPSHVDSHHGSHHDPFLFILICRWANLRGISAVRPQFNLSKRSAPINIIKNGLNYYAKFLLKSQADFFGDLGEFEANLLNKNSKIELMVHAIPTNSAVINDLDGINIEEKILALDLVNHNKCSYRDF